MSGIFSISVEEARGFVAVPADLDRIAVVIGCSSLGSKLSSFFLSGQSAVSSLGYGDGVDVLTQTIEQRQASGTAVKFPAAMYTCPKTTPGSYGAVDQTGVSGTAQTATHGATLPFGTDQLYFRITKGGFVGTSGIEFVWSRDDGRHVSRTTALGTDTSFTFPNANARFDFSPSTADLTALNTLLNQEKTKYEAHRIDIAGGIHGAADNTNTITAANASDTPTRIALANDLRAKINAHEIDLAGGIHGAADLVDTITAPVATDDSSALILALQIKTKLNAHEINTTGGIHGAADNTNTVTAPAPVAGAFAVGDIVRCRTFAPAPVAADLDTAFADLAASTADFSLVVIDMPMTRALLSNVSAGLDVLAAVGKKCTALVRSRIPNFESSESEATWLVAVNAEFAPYNDSRITVRSEYGLLTDAMTSNQYMRSDLAQVSADLVRIGRADFPNTPADQQEQNFTLVDDTGATVGHDEGPRGSVTGLSDDTQGNRQWSAQRLPDNARREAVYGTVPWVLYAADERIRNIAVRRIANSMERVAVTAGTSALGARLRYFPANPNVPGSLNLLAPASRKAIHSKIFSAVSAEFQKDIQNPNDAGLDTGLVQVNPVISVSGGNLLGLEVILAPIVFGVLLNLKITLAVQE